DWPLQGICCAALVEGERLWFVTSRGEVRCLDTEGFHDGEDDGDFQDDPQRLGDLPTASPDHATAIKELDAGRFPDSLKEILARADHDVNGEIVVKVVDAGKEWSATGSFGGINRTINIRPDANKPQLSMFKTLGIYDKRDADTIWCTNMMTQLGVSQHNMACCSVTAYGDLLFVNTGNGVDEEDPRWTAPNAASFVCLDKNTGEILWTNKEPGSNILHGQWSSPMVAELAGKMQVVFAGGDGWLYSFAADRGTDGKPNLLWKFDCNPKETIWILGGEGTRNNIIGTPVAYKGCVYVAVGQDPEHYSGPGHLWCIDPSGSGDVSLQLAMETQADGKQVPIAHARVQAVNPEKNQVAVDNPNSKVVWHYTGSDQDGDGEIVFEEEMHRTCGTIAIKDDLLYVADFGGIVHCLDAMGNDDGTPKVHWTYDMLADSWSSPLISDGKVYIGDEDGEVAIFELGKDNNEPMEEIFMGSSVYTTAVAANNSIFITSKNRLFKISEKKSE
ncbi:MAG: PQQ-binding-like beta-propeller repeat protein, partial [Planctomycetota bacterium]